jgi:hypothetical protein
VFARSVYCGSDFAMKRGCDDNHDCISV